MISCDGVNDPEWSTADEVGTYVCNVISCGTASSLSESERDVCVFAGENERVVAQASVMDVAVIL